MFDLSGKIAFITGASSGIGLECAKALSKQGAKVAIAARRIDRLEQLANQLKSQGKEVLVLPMDVTKKTEIDQAVGKTIEKFGRLDILVNNAGIAEFSPFLELTEEAWDKTLDTNLKGYFLTAQAAVKQMVKNHSGRIINISSVAMGGVGIGFPNIVHYCTSKAGIVGFTEALADEMAQENITVNCIAPGLIETEMTQGITQNPQQLTAMTSQIPLKRAGKAEEIATAVVYFASNEASYATGSTLVIDGGWLSA